MKRVVVLGPGWPLRGGLATFDHRLVRQFISEGDQCELVSYSLQYPSLLFPGKSQFSDEAAPEGITIHSWVNSVNPLNWLSVARKIRKMQPDLIVARYWLPFMGPALGTILRQAKGKQTRIVCIADNVIPHEHRPGDMAFTRYFLKACDAFVTMSEKVLEDLRRFEKDKPAQLVRHPLYDNFGEHVPKETARRHLGLQPGDRLLLFFGFIRQYKGLDLLLEAMADPRIAGARIRVLVAGEFYEDERPYRDIIEKHQLQNAVILHNKFIPDSEVKYYLCAADGVVQPYRKATQSGVTPLAYYFERPMIVTNVGGLPDLVPDQKAGLVCEPTPAAIADAMLAFYQLGENYFIPHLRTEKLKYSWGNLTATIRKLAFQSP